MPGSSSEASRNAASVLPGQMKTRSTPAARSVANIAVAASGAVRRAVVSVAVIAARS